MGIFHCEFYLVVLYFTGVVREIIDHVEPLYDNDDDDVSCYIDSVVSSFSNDVVVSALGIRTRGLFHWVATLGKLFTHTASPVSHLLETG